MVVEGAFPRAVCSAEILAETTVAFGSDETRPPLLFAKRFRRMFSLLSFGFASYWATKKIRAHKPDTLSAL